MDVFSALSDPTRRSIFEVIASNGKISATDISRQFDVSAPAVSQHLKVLLETNLVRVEKKAQQRLYQINAQPLLDLEDWIKKMTKIWDDRFSRLDQVLEIEKTKLKGGEK